MGAFHTIRVVPPPDVRELIFTNGFPFTVGVTVQAQNLDFSSSHNVSVFIGPTADSISMVANDTLEPGSPGCHVNSVAVQTGESVYVYADAAGAVRFFLTLSN